MHPLRHQGVRRVALQAADLNRLTFGFFTHTSLFAKRFGGADPGAHAAHDVLRQNRLGRRLGGAGGDLTDEKRDVDIGGAGRDAGRIMAEIAAIRGHQGLVISEGRVQIGKSGAERIGVQSARNNPFFQSSGVHLHTPRSACSFVKRSHGSKILSTGKIFKPALFA